MAPPAPQNRALATRRRVVCTLLGAAGAWLCVSARLPRAGAEEAAAGFRVIVHPDNRIGSVARGFLSDAFLKKVTRWENGGSIHPVDQRPASDVRKRFSEAVLRRSVSAVRNYWQQRIFSGRDVPPPELDSDDAVVAYVLAHSGAVGYVSGAAKLSGARAIAVEGE